MKTLQFILLTFFISSTSLIVAQGSTTLEEFNYIESGIPTQLSTGQDVYKKGYTAANLYSMKWKSGAIEEYIILKRNHDNSIAGFGVYTTSGWQMCIPINNSELMNRYRKDIKQFSLQQAQDYAWSLSFAFAAGMDELNKELIDSKASFADMRKRAHLYELIADVIFEELSKDEKNKEFLDMINIKIQEQYKEKLERKHGKVEWKKPIQNNENK